MSRLPGRSHRSDDWPTPHARALAGAAEQLDGQLDAGDTTWLADHLAACPACAAAAEDFASQRLELRALRDRQPAPPRDLWARTAAAIEREAGFRADKPRRTRRLALAPFALLSGTLVVALVVGALTSSQLPGVETTATPDSGIANVTPTPSPPVATPFLLPAKQVAWISEENGRFNFNRTSVVEVCPEAAAPCKATVPTETRSLALGSNPSTVFGSSDGESLIVVGDDGGGISGSNVYVVPVAGALATPTASIDASPPPTTAASPVGTPNPTPNRTASVPTVPPVSTPSTPSPSVQTSGPSESPPSATPNPASPSATPIGAIQIASGIQIVDGTAAYSPDGSTFAFTARPADGSQGPDIYAWHVGDALAVPITSDHRSVFGSWVRNAIVGSAIDPATTGEGSEPTAFILDPASTTLTTIPQVGRAWRPAVDPTGRSAVYWAGTLSPSADGVGWQTDRGRLVLGRWEIPTTPASDAPHPTRLATDQAKVRAETTLAEGPLTGWEAHWDDTGTRLAVWIADRRDPTIGMLSLYVVDPFDGHIDLESPPLKDQPALAGFSIAHGTLVWGAPPDKTSRASRVQILAWTENGFGQVESHPGDVIVVR